jgi:hypothetical protein
MLLDILNETRLTLHEVAKRCHVNLSTTWRWVLSGIVINGKRVKLRTVRLGGRRVTSTEELQRFFERCNPQSPPEQPVIRTQTQIDRESADAGRALEKKWARRITQLSV